MTTPATWLGRARRVVVFTAVGLALYGFTRFDVVRLPDGARSPLFGLHPGDRLLVDRHSRSASEGQMVLFRGTDGGLRIGRVEVPPAAVPPDSLWLIAEREVAGAEDSRTLGPIAREDLAGRVLFVLPW